MHRRASITNKKGESMKVSDTTTGVSSLWRIIVEDMTRGGNSRTLSLLKLAYTVTVPDPLFWTAGAHFFMVCAPRRSVLNQRYAIEFYKKNRQWIPLIAAAQEGLFFPELRFISLKYLLEAAVHAEHAEYIQLFGGQVCGYHADGGIYSEQLLAIFFNAIMPYYHRQLLCDSVLRVRQCLYTYNRHLSALLYAKMQAHLYAYTTAVAQELIGQPDPLLSA